MTFIKNLGPIQKRLLLVAALVIVIGGGVAIYKATHRPPDPKEDTVVPTKSSNVGAANKDKSSNASQKSSSAGAQSDNSGELVAPSGTLVSNHRPGQNGSNMIVASQCITTPGAKCYIKITKGSSAITLPSKTVDGSGSVYWERDVKDAGLTQGSWTVTAVATLNGQTQTTTDQIPPEVL